MKTIFLILMGVVILSGAAAGYFFFMDKSIAADNSNKHMADAVDHKKDDHGAPVENLIQQVALEPLILPIINQNGVAQTISVVVILEVDDMADAATVAHYKPRIADAFLKDLYGALSRQASMQGGVVQVEELKKRLDRVSQKVMGAGVIDNVVLELVHQRKV